MVICLLHCTLEPQVYLRCVGGGTASSIASPDPGVQQSGGSFAKTVQPFRIGRMGGIQDPWVATHGYSCSSSGMGIPQPRPTFPSPLPFSVSREPATAFAMSKPVILTIHFLSHNPFPSPLPLSVSPPPLCIPGSCHSVRHVQTRNPYHPLPFPQSLPPSPLRASVPPCFILLPIRLIRAIRGPTSPCFRPVPFPRPERNATRGQGRFTLNPASMLDCARTSALNVVVQIKFVRVRP